MDNLRRAILLITVVVFVVVGVSGFFIALDYYNASKVTVDELDYDGEKYNPGEQNTPGTDVVENTFNDNILFVIGDEKRSSAEIFSLVNINTESKKINVLYIPCDTKYSLESNKNGIQRGVLADYYKKHGAEQFTLLLSGMLDVPVGKYIYMDFNDFASFINHFSSRDSGVEFELPISLQANHSSGNKINLTAGKQFFDGNTAKQLAMFYKTDDGIYTPELLNYYDGSQTCRINMLAGFTKAFAEQKLLSPDEKYYTDNFYSLINSVFADCVTNVTDNDIQIVSAEIGKFEKNSIGFYTLVCETVKAGEAMYTQTILDLSIDDGEAMTKDETASFLAENFNSNSK